MSQVWFSAMLRFVIVASCTAEQFARSVVVVRAEDFPGALHRAIAVGRTMEARYVGGEGHGFELRFKDVETLDLLGDTITDGREIYAEFERVPAELAEEAARPGSPEASSPGQSGV